MNIRNDPKTYRELSNPFATNEEANAALRAFFDDVEAARRKHKIADVIALCEIVVEIEGEETRGSGSLHMGDASRQLVMLAREFGAAQQAHQEMLALVVARARKSR